MIFFTADHHYFHKNVIRHCNRPFKNVEEMNQIMLENWNRVVSEKDTVYHLGDIFWSKREEDVIPILGQLNGRIVLIKGNHDKGGITKFEDFYSEICIYRTTKVNIGEPVKKKIVMCHYPFESWDNKAHDSWHLHGHCHGGLRSIRNRIDVGVDIFNYTPISLDKLVDEMNIRDRAFLKQNNKWEK